MSRLASLEMRVGVVVTTFNRPGPLAELVDHVHGWTRRPDRLVVVNNGRHANLPGSVETIEPGHNVGLPAAISLGFDSLSDCDRILVLDDDTLLQADTLERMAGIQAGAVTVAGSWTREVEGGEGLVFPWSPTMLQRSAIAEIGRPRAELFFGWDDWEYSLRLVAAGYSVSWLEDVAVVRQTMSSSWPGRAYLSARNLAYIRFRLGNRHPVFDGPWGSIVRKARRPGHRLIRLGVWHGLRGRMGHPPPGILPDW